MSADPQQTLIWMQRAVAWAVLLQSIEILQLRSSWSHEGVWRSEWILKDFQGFPAWFQKTVTWLFNEKHFYSLLIASVISATLIWLYPHPVFLAVLLLSTFITALRWRGTFNGGSDCMTFLILISGLVASLFSQPLIGQACLWYVTFQTCLSFFISGLVKMRNKNWRTGHALVEILEVSTYPVPENLRRLSKPLYLSKLFSWILILFEIFFPASLLHPKLALMFISVALIFQLLNWVVFGLNRFFWAWAAAYPAIYFCSQWSF